MKTYGKLKACLENHINYSVRTHSQQYVKYSCMSSYITVQTNLVFERRNHIDFSNSLPY